MWQGALKKKPADPCVYLLTFRGTNQPQIFFWGRFSVKGVQKHDKNTSVKVQVESFFRGNSQKIDNISFSSTFLFYRVFRCFLAMGVQKHYEKRFAKKRVENKKPKTDFYRFFEIAFLGVSR
jgi:hypothetical protein